MKTKTLTIAVLLWSCANLAIATTIDFEPSFPGAPTDRYTVLTNQLASYGILFSTTDPEGVFWWGPTYPWVPAQYSIAAGDWGTVQGVDPIRVDFSTYVVEASIRGFDGGGDVDTLILKAFNISDELVDSMNITDVFSTPGRVASVSAQEIAYITFEVSVSGQHGLFFDDLTYAIPEPATVFLLGLGGLIIRRLKFKN
jgi:hypothetical protein